MLAIQPNFRTNGMQHGASFGNKKPVDYDDFDETDLELQEDSFVSQKDNDLSAVKDEITGAMSNLKEIQEELPPAAKKAMSGLFTLGAAAVAGISTKFGVSETSKLVKGISQKDSVKAATKNLKTSVGKLGKAIAGLFETVKKSDLYQKVSTKASELFEKFAATPFGKKAIELFNNVADSKFVKKVKDIFALTKKVNGDKVVDRTGDVLGAATGISTAAVGIINPEQNENNPEG